MQQFRCVIKTSHEILLGMLTAESSLTVCEAVLH